MKLHPFESLSARSRLVERVLGDADRRLVEISNEAISERLLRRIWFAVTVESSTAVECALAGVPSFLCGWFDLDLYAYAKQYQKFGAARILDSPLEILRIPDSLGLPAGTGTVQRLHHAITPEDLAAILRSNDRVQARNGPWDGSTSR